MKKSNVQNLIGILLCGFSLMANAAQTCRTEAEIPSTTPTGRFTDHGNGTVSDTQTGLMWAKCSLGQNEKNCSGIVTTHTWQGALDAAAGSTLASHSDWRLPNINELRSIVELRCYLPAINLTLFPNTPPTHYWSASPYAYHSYYAWDVIFNYGYSNSYYRTNYYRAVRLVRGGQ